MNLVLITGLSKFAKLARSVTRSRSVLVSQFSSHLPNLKDPAKQSHLAHVSFNHVSAPAFCLLNLVCMKGLRNGCYIARKKFKAINTNIKILAHI